jgi:hypothetical protein
LVTGFMLRPSIQGDAGRIAFQPESLGRNKRADSRQRKLSVNS